VADGPPREDRAELAAAPWLVDHVDPEAAAQEDVLEALASVRRGFPCLGELSEAMPHDERKFASVGRDLIEHISVITVKGLPVRGLLLHGVVSAGVGDHGSADCKTALFLDDQRPWLVLSGGYCTCRSNHGGPDQQECVEQLRMPRGHGVLLAVDQCHVRFGKPSPLHFRSLSRLSEASATAFHALGPGEMSPSSL